MIKHAMAALGLALVAGVVHADGIVEVGPHERQNFGVVVGGKWLVGDAAIVGVADDPAVATARTARERDREQQNGRTLCRCPQVQPELRWSPMANPRPRTGQMELSSW